jgi:hypothetical protein
MRTLRPALLALSALALLVLPASADDQKGNLQKGTPELKSAGALTFGPDGLLFVGDAQGAAVFAIDTGDNAGSAKPINVEGIDQKVASLLGTDPQQILINDMAVNPASGRADLSVSRGRGPDAAPVIVRVEPSGKLAEFALEDVPFAKADLPGAPDPNAQERGRSLRSQSITDLAFADGRLFVAGLSNEEFSSRLLALPYPFRDSSDSASVEFYHGSHGRFETKSPVRTFLAAEIQGQPYLLAAYTCTPLVKLPIEQLKAGSHVMGTTIAELGNRNNPLDMVAYQQGGKDYLLLANSSRGVMKIDIAGAEKAAGITKPIQDTAGMPFKTIEELKGVTQLDRLDEGHALILVQTDAGAQNLKTIELP